jgi:hypothetical protein
MTSGKFLPPDGDPKEFLQLQSQFRDRFKPFDEAEDALVERMVAAEFKMRSVRYMDAGIFHYELKTNPMPQHFSEDERTNPLAWAFQCDSAGHNSFSKLIRYEGFLQREFSRSLRDLYKMQDERRAREAEAAKAPPANPKKNTKQTQSPDPTNAPNGPVAPDPPQNSSPNPLPGRRGGPPQP